MAPKFYPQNNDLVLFTTLDNGTHSLIVYSLSKKLVIKTLVTVTQDDRILFQISPNG